MRARMIAVLAGALVMASLVVVDVAPASAATFSNTGSIPLQDPNFPGNPNCSDSAVLCNATAGTYPSTIVVSGQTGTVSGVSLSLNNVTYSYSDDIDALLVSPSGQSLIVIAAVGPNTGSLEAANNSTLTVSDGGTLPTDLTAWGPAPTFKPANFGSYGLGASKNGFNGTYPSPAPPAPWGDPGQNGTNATLANTFGGINPNGTWSLYVITTSAGDGTGAIAGGWSLNITTAASAAPTTTVLTPSPNPSFTSGANSSVTLTANVTSATAVNEGTVDFTDGGVTIAGCGAQPVSGGTATCTTTFTSEGDHGLEALYGGDSNFGASNGTVTQQVNNHTTVTGSSYCNTGSITLENPPSSVADSAPYPSRVFASGLSGTLSHLTVTLNGVTYSQSQDIDALLVGPAGQTMILVAAAGPNSSGAMSNVTLTLDDNATSTLSSSAIWGAPGATVTSKPVNYGGLNETWGAPAPSGPYGNPGPFGGGTATLGSQFDGTNPNGTWSLYVITTAAGDGAGAIAGGWCASLTTASAAATNTAVSSDNNPSFTTAPSNTVTFTATVTEAINGGSVSEGTVDFMSDGVTIPTCGAVAVNSGTATCTTNYTQEGSFSVEALYGGDSNFGASNASLTQQVNDHTTFRGNNFCNTGSLSLNNPTVANPEIGATPYPSNIFVSGLGDTLQHLTVTLNGVTYSQSQDIDALLVGPGGQTMILVAAAGPNSSGAMSNVTLTLDDNATSTLSSSAIWGAPGATVTSKPVNYGGLNETWGAPAPSGPYGNPGPFGGGTATLGSQFDGTNPNGTWSLYVITTAAGDGAGAIAGGWCASLTAPAATNTALASSVNPSFTSGAHSSVTLTATVTKASDSSSFSEGTVDFTDGGVTIAGCGAQPVSSGTATCTTTFTSQGSHGLEALYGGDTNFAPSNDSVTQQVDVHPATATNLMPSEANSVFGQSVTFTATVSEVPPGMGTPTGTVLFKDNGVAIERVPLSSGSASLTTSGLHSGDNRITARYSGGGVDADAPSQSSAVPFFVSRAQTTTLLTTSSSTSASGQPVTFTATVSPVAPGAGTPTGNEIFKDGSTVIAVVALSSASAQFTTSTLAVGTHMIRATYARDRDFLGSTSLPVQQTVTSGG